MNTQLIMLPEQPILVSDEEIKVDDYIYWNKKVTKAINTTYSKSTKKIIAGIEGLPSIDFSGLSEEVCKRIGWVDVFKMSKNKYPYSKRLHKVDREDDEMYKDLLREGFEVGFKTAQSLNDKKFSLEDIEEAMKNIASEIVTFDGVIDANSPASIYTWVQAYLNKLSQPKVFNVEVEMEEVKSSTYEPCTKWIVPKITNNSIKIIKIL